MASDRRERLPGIERRYELTGEGEELRISTTMGGGGRGGRGNRGGTQVYERWHEQ